MHKDTWVAENSASSGSKKETHTVKWWGELDEVRKVNENQIRYIPWLKKRKKVRLYLFKAGYGQKFCI